MGPMDHDPELPQLLAGEAAMIQQQDAVSELCNVHEVPPEDGTATAVLRDAENKLGKCKAMEVPKEHSTSQPTEAGEGSLVMKSAVTDAGFLQAMRGNPVDTRLLQNDGLHDDHNSMEAYTAGGVPEEMVQAATEMLSNIEPGDFVKMLEVVSSWSGKKIPDTTNEMVNMASAGVSEVPPEGLQKIVSLLNMDGLSSPRMTEDSSCRRSKLVSALPATTRNSDTWNSNANESCRDTSESDVQCVQSLRGDTEANRLSENDLFNSEPDSLAALGSGGISTEIVKIATDMISNSDPEELQKMLEVAFSLNVRGPMFNTVDSPSRLGFDFPDISLEMVKMASDKVSNMTPEELQKMLEVPPLVNMNVIFSPRPPTHRSKSCSEMSVVAVCSARGKSNTEEIPSSHSCLNSKLSQSSSCLLTTLDGFSENMQHLKNDPATQKMFTHMTKNKSPEIMKLPCAEAVEAQDEMSEVSEDDSDAMVPQEERIQGPEPMEKTTVWFIGKAGLNLAICMMLMAFLFHKLGYIRG